MAKRPRLVTPEFVPPPGAAPLLVQRLAAYLEQALAEKTQILLALLALVKAQGGEVSFPIQEVKPQDRLHFRIEAGITTLSYEAAEGSPAPLPPSGPPPPPRPKLWTPGDPA